MTADEARTAIKSLGELVSNDPHTDPKFTILTFVKYDTGARDGRWHQYKHLTLPLSVWEEIRHELK